MNETLKNLCARFYTPPAESEIKLEIEDAYCQLIQRLDKLERRLILRVIDAKDRVAETRSIDSFICGFELARKLSAELNLYDEARPVDETGRVL